MNRKYLIIGGVLGAVLLLLVILIFATGGKCKKGDPKCAPPSNKDDKITLTYWRPFDDTEVFQDVIDDYKEDHPNVTIQYRKVDPATYEKELLENFATDGGPDLFSVGNSWIPKYQDKIVPAPDDLIKMDDIERNFFPVVKEDGVIDGKLYALPYSVDTLALYVNSEMLDQAGVTSPPTTWSELVGDFDSDTGKPVPNGNPGVLGKLNKIDGREVRVSGIALGSSMVSRAEDVLALMMLQQKKDVMVNKERDRAVFDEGTRDGSGKEVFYGRNALEFFTSFSTPGNKNYSYNATLGDSIQAFADKKVMMTPGYAYQIQTLKRAKPDLRYDIMPMLQLKPGEPVNYANYQTEVVSKKSKHQKEAWEFIKFVASREHLTKYAEKAELPPSRKDVAPSGRTETFYNQSQTAVSWYQGDYAESRNIFLDMIKSVNSGVAPVTAIKQGATRQTDVLRRTKERLSGRSPSPAPSP